MQGAGVGVGVGEESLVDSVTFQPDFLELPPSLPSRSVLSGWGWKACRLIIKGFKEDSVVAEASKREMPAHDSVSSVPLRRAIIC